MASVEISRKLRLECEFIFLCRKIYIKKEREGGKKEGKERIFFKWSMILNEWREFTFP